MVPYNSRKSDNGEGLNDFSGSNPEKNCEIPTLGNVEAKSSVSLTHSDQSRTNADDMSLDHMSPENSVVHLKLNHKNSSSSIPKAETSAKSSRINRVEANTSSKRSPEIIKIIHGSSTITKESEAKINSVLPEEDERLLGSERDKASQNPQDISPTAVRENIQQESVATVLKKIKTSNTILIDSLSRNVNKSHLEEIFGIYGNVLTIFNHGSSLKELCGCQCLIEYETADQGALSIAHLNRGQLDGCVLRIFLFEERRKTISSDVNDNQILKNEKKNSGTRVQNNKSPVELREVSKRKPIKELPQRSKSRSRGSLLNRATRHSSRSISRESRYKKPRSNRSRARPPLRRSSRSTEKSRSISRSSGSYRRSCTNSIDRKISTKGPVQKNILGRRGVGVGTSAVKPPKSKIRKRSVSRTSSTSRSKSLIRRRSGSRPRRKNF